MHWLPGLQRPAEMTWKAGVDVRQALAAPRTAAKWVSSSDLLLTPPKAWEFELRRKRGAHPVFQAPFPVSTDGGLLQDDRGGRPPRKPMTTNAPLILADGLRAAGATMFAMNPNANMIFAKIGPRRNPPKVASCGKAKYYCPMDARWNKW